MLVVDKYAGEALINMLFLTCEITWKRSDEINYLNDKETHNKTEIEKRRKLQIKKIKVYYSLKFYDMFSNKKSYLNL